MYRSARVHTVLLQAVRQYCDWREDSHNSKQMSFQSQENRFVCVAILLVARIAIERIQTIWLEFGFVSFYRTMHLPGKFDFCSNANFDSMILWKILVFLEDKGKAFRISIIVKSKESKTIWIQKWNNYYHQKIEKKYLHMKNCNSKIDLILKWVQQKVEYCITHKHMWWQTTSEATQSNIVIKCAACIFLLKCYFAWLWNFHFKALTSNFRVQRNAIQ